MTPTVEAQRNALHHSVVQYDRLSPTLANLKRTLQAGYPFLFTFAVTKGMDKWFRDRDIQISTRFLLTLDQFSKTDIVGAHTVLVVGYDDMYLHTGAFLCRNSWGPQWGQDGHFWFAYADVAYPDLSSSFFIVREVCVSNEPRCVNRLDCNDVYSPDVCQDVPPDLFTT